MATFLDSWRAGGSGYGAYVLGSTTTAQIPLTLQLSSGQIVNALEVKNSSGTVIFSVSPVGNVSYTGSETVTDAITVTGNITGQSALSIAGLATFTGGILSDSLTVTGNTNLNVVNATNITINNNLITNSFAYFNRAFYLNEQVNSPTHIAEKGAIYTKDATSVTELFYKDSDGNETQITSGGAVGGDDVFIPDDKYLRLGNTTATPDVVLGWNTAQTVDAVYFGLATGQNTLIVAEYGDVAYDFAHGAQTNPTIFIQSATQSATQWGSLTHDQTDFSFISGAGAIKFSPATNVTAVLPATGKVYLNGTTTRTGTTEVLDIDATIDTTTAGDDVNVATITATRAAADTGGTIGLAISVTTGAMADTEVSYGIRSVIITSACTVNTSDAIAFEAGAITGDVNCRETAFLAQTGWDIGLWLKDSALQMGSTNLENDCSTFTMIKGAQVGDPQVQFALSADAVGDFSITASLGDIKLNPAINLEVLMPAAGYTYIDGVTTTHTDTNGVLKVACSSATNNVIGTNLTSANIATTGNTAYNLYSSLTSTAVVTGTNQNLYSGYFLISKTGLDTSVDTTSVYGVYSTATNTGSTNAGTKNTYAGYFTATGDANGASTTYAVYVAAQSGDTNYAIYAAAGNFLIDTGSIQMGTATTDCSTFTMIKGTVGSDPQTQLAIDGSGNFGITTTVGDITLTAADDFFVSVDGNLELGLNGTELYPYVSGGISLGTTTYMWNGLYLTTATAINWNNGEITQTEAATGLVFAGTGMKNFTVTQAAGTGAPVALTITGGAHTAITAATEDFGVNFNFSATKTWAAGAGPLATQREVIFQAPTYDGNAGGALTITKAATVAITNAPQDAGANITITNAYALWVQAGLAQFDGGVAVSVMSISGTNPTLNFYDTDCTDSEISASIDAQATDTGSGTEDVDVTFKQKLAGALTAFLTSDADGNLTLGLASQTIAVNGGNLQGIGTISNAGLITNTAGAVEALRLATNVDDYTKFTLGADGGLTIQSIDAAAAAANIAIIADGTFAITSTGFNLTSAGVISGVTTLSMNNQLTNSLADGTAPMVITSTTKVTNLNVDRIDDLHSSAAISASGALSITANVYALHATGGTAVTIAHSTADGYVHIPSGGTANQILKNSGVAGTGSWGAVTENAGALAAVTTLGMGGDLTDYEATNDASPSIFLGSSATERLEIQAVYDGGAQTLNYIQFQTYAASATADKGKYIFGVDGTDILSIVDAGLVIANSTAGAGIDLNVAGTTYTTLVGAIDVVRTGNLTGIDTETIVDVNVKPAFTLTEPGAGSVNYYGVSIDMSGLAVTAGAGTSVVSALYLKADDDADTGTNYALFVDDGNSRFDGRVLWAKGADVVSANDTTVGNDGNSFDITGATQMNGIATVGWTTGSIIILQFDSTPTVKHNTAASAGFASFALAGSADFSATAGDTLTLWYDGTVWKETARTAI